MVRSNRSDFQLNDFEKRQEAMIYEAKDHNELLQELCKTDKEYEMNLHTFYYRKRLVSDYLG